MKTLKAVIVISLVILLGYSPIERKSISLRDYTCVQDCLSKGYAYRFCTQLCEY